MRRVEFLKKFTSLNPWTQSAIALCLLVFLFFLQGLAKFPISNKTVLLAVLTKGLKYFNDSIAIGLLFFATIWISEFALLIVKTVKHQPLKEKNTISTPTKYVLGSYVAAMCFLLRDYTAGLFVKTSLAKLLSVISWAVVIMGVAVMLISAFRMMLYWAEREDECQNN